MKQIESGAASAAAEGRETSLPYGFDQREKMRAAEAKAAGAADAAGGVRPRMAARRPGRERERRVQGGRDGALGNSGGGVCALVGQTRRPRRHKTPSSRLDAVNPKPETALLRVATHTLETLTATLRAKPVPLDAEDRAASARARKKAWTPCCTAGERRSFF